MTIDLRHGDSLEVLRTLPDASCHSIVTDGPYGIRFMGKKWDYDVPSVEVWQECLRVLKPGGYLLAFASTRTQHRMATRIEDGGFEIQDMIAWIHSGGMPKSHDVSKALDKHAGCEREFTGKRVRGGGRAARGGEELVGSSSIESLKWREVTFPSSDAAKQWDGWGTALKPHFEPITVARKPREVSIPYNILKHGVGALHIDACRIHADDVEGGQGRWPANIITDGSGEVVSLFPARAGAQSPVAGSELSLVSVFHADSGSAARFFYCAKVTQYDRHEGTSNGNPHITVKPTALMQYLVRLVTPPGGVVLDPYMGSGSTGKAAEIEGFSFIGIDNQAVNVAVASERIGAGAPLFRTSLHYED